MEFQASDIQSLFWELATLIAGWQLHPQATALLCMRWVGLVSFTPGLDTDTVGMRFRMALAVLLAGIMAPGIDPATLPDLDQKTDWFIALSYEFLIGTALGLSVSLWISAARSAGEWAALVSGLSMQTTYQPDMDGDPDAPPTAVGRLFAMLGLFLFFSGRGPMRLMDLVQASLKSCPPGAILAWPSLQMAEPLFGRVGEALALSVLAAWPIIVALTTAQIALALAIQTQSVLLSLSLMAPTRLAIGLIIIAAGLAGVATDLSGTLDNWTIDSTNHLRVLTPPANPGVHALRRDSADADTVVVQTEAARP